jgi:hypothetical protein
MDAESNAMQSMRCVRIVMMLLFTSKTRLESKARRRQQSNRAFHTILPSLLSGRRLEPRTLSLIHSAHRKIKTNKTQRKGNVP